MGKTTHGLRYHRAYNTWNHMMSRCYNTKDARYNYYGGRGILVDPSWHSFSGFWNDMKGDYNDNLTLDRVDVNGPYTKSNCRWVNWQQQQRNRSNNLYVTYKDQPVLLKVLCEEKEVNYNLIWQRVFKYKWDLERALVTKSRIKTP